MSIRLLEKPSIIRRADAALVLFPSRPYWFAASEEVAPVLEAFEGQEPEEIIGDIQKKLGIPYEDATETYNQVAELLFSSGVLMINGETGELPEFAPGFQVNDVENVLVIATTNGCNMACPMCYAHASRPMSREMTTAEIKAIVDQLDVMPWENRVSRVALTGGELFTRPDALELIDHVLAHGYFVQVNTNATLLTEADIEHLAADDRLKLSISLDGCCAKTHDAIRGEGNFDKTVATVRSLTAHGVSVAINMFVHEGNLDEIEGTLHLADSLGVSGFNALNMMHVGRGNSPATKRELIAVPLAVFYRKVFEIIRDNPRFQELMRYSTFANQLMGIAAGVKSTTCGIGTNRAVYVKPDGSLYPCADTAIPAFRLGNLRTDSLTDIWGQSPLLTELRELNIDTMNERCAACDVRYQCAGNCRGENYQTTRDLRSPHFKCEEIRDSVLELMWILTEAPELFRDKVEDLNRTVANTHATSA